MDFFSEKPMKLRDDMMIPDKSGKMPNFPEVLRKDKMKKKWTKTFVFYFL